MCKIILRSGDIFSTRNPMALGRMINFVQRIWAHDNKSRYSHTGNILDPVGTTFEANWHIEKQNLFVAYKGKFVLIVRYKEMTPEKFAKGWHGIKDLEGKLYPFHRLFFHLIPIFAKHIHLFKKPVCSELVGKFLFLVGARHKYYMGTNVDTLVDEWKNYGIYEVVYEGIL